MPGWAWVVVALAVAAAVALGGAQVAMRHVKEHNIETKRQDYYRAHPVDDDNPSPKEARETDKKLNSLEWAESHKGDPDPELDAAARGLSYTPPIPDAPPSAGAPPS